MDSSEESLPPQSQTTQTSSPASSKIPFGLPERTSRHWDRKVKERVLLELDAGNSVGVLSNRYGIPRRTIRNWKSRGINNSYGSGGGNNRTLNLSSTQQSPNVSAPAAIKQQYLMSMANGNAINNANQLNTSGNCTLTKDQEKILYDRIQRLSEFNQASIKEEKLQEIAYDFLDEYNIEHNFEYGKVDADWLDKFLYRNRHLGKLFTFISNEFYDLNNTNNDNNLEVINNALLTIKSGGKINIVAKKFNINEEILCARLKKESLIKPLLSNQQEIKLIQKLNTFKFPTSPSLIILTKSKIRAEIISFLSLLGINYNHKSGYDWITEFVSQYYLQLYDQHNRNNGNNNNININNGNHNHNNKNNNSKYNNNSDDEEFKNSLNNIKDATEDIKSGIPIRIVALKYNLPYQILRKWYAIETFLNKKHELYFVNSIKQMMLTKASIKNLLYEYCEKNFIPFQFTNQDDNTDHYDDDDDEFNYWYENFIETYSYLNIVTERQNASAKNNNTATPSPLNNINHVTRFKQGATFFNRSANQSTPRIAAVHQNVNTNCDELSRTQDDQDQEDDDNNNNDDDDDDDDENDNDKEDNNGDDNTEQNSSQDSNVPSDDDGDERELQIDEDNNDSSDSEDDQNNDDTNNEEPAPSKKHHPDGSQSNDFSAGAATYDDASATDIINDLQTDADKDDDDMKFDYSLLNTDFYNDVTNYYENENDDLNAAKRKRWDNETKQRIMKCITAGESVAVVSDRYKVPRRTIQNWKSILLETSEDFKKGILKLEEEFDLLSKLQVLKQNGAVITKRKFLEMVYAYCEEHNIKHPFRNGKAGRKWFINFQKRHPQFDIDSNDISLGDIPDDSFYQNDSIL